MRFGQTLQTSVYPPWKAQYIDYPKLKKLLRENEAGQQWTEGDEEAFVHELINVQLGVQIRLIDGQTPNRSSDHPTANRISPLAVSVHTLPSAS